MRYKVFFLLIALLAGTAHGWAQDQTRTVNDTIYNPKVIFSGNPQKYEIAGIKVTGVDNYEDYIIIGYSGLAVGQRIDIPGDEITNAAKRFWHQGLFSKVQIKVDKIYGNKAWLEFVLRQQPRVSVINYVGMKKGEQKDITEKLGLQVGNQMTPNIADRIKMIVEKYFKDKGFEKVTCEVNQREDLSKQNEVIVDIVVDKHSKIKVHKIYIDGNQVLSDGRIKRTMKKTNEKGSLIKLFSQKKFVASDYAADKQRIIDKYNELGYRDARIVSDSVTNYDEKTVDVHIKVDEGKRYYISGINWVGNTVYPTEVLQNVLGMEKGDVYNQKLLNKRTSTDEDAVSNLYLDKGYLFFNLVPVETKVEGDSIQLEMRMYEGKQARINKVVINGNDRLYEKVVRRELRVRPGDLFSKSDLMRSAREIAQTGHFDPEKMDIRPEPNEENGTVDIVMNLQSKANDQVEFSAGWGQTGVIGKLSLKFTNFSIHNLFHPSSYKGIIPQGEGQTFTISGQTNAKYYCNKDLMVEQACKLAALVPNSQIKAPTSKAGVEAFEELTYRGVSINATVSFTCAQAVAVGEAVERGLKRREAEGLDISWMHPVCTIMIGRTDDYLKNVVKASDMCIPAEALDLAGVAVMKNAYKVYKERGFRTTLLTAAYRNYHHYVDFLGGDIIFTITSDWQRKFANCDWIEMKNNMDTPVDEFYLNCLKQIPEFIQAYEPDGLKPEEFQHYGAFLATMKQFLGGYDSLVQLIRSYMIV